MIVKVKNKTYKYNLSEEKEGDFYVLYLNLSLIRKFLFYSYKEWEQKFELAKFKTKSINHIYSEQYIKDFIEILNK